VSAYRALPVAVERYEVGSRRAYRVQLALGALLLLMAAVGAFAGAHLSAVLKWAVFAVVGGVLVVRARYAAIEICAGEREARITVARLGREVLTRVPLDELVAARVVATRSWFPVYALQIARAHGEPIVLKDADGAAVLEPERELLARFLETYATPRALRPPPVR